MIVKLRPTSLSCRTCISVNVGTNKKNNGKHGGNGQHLKTSFDISTFSKFLFCLRRDSWFLEKAHKTGLLISNKTFKIFARRTSRVRGGDVSPVVNRKNVSGHLP